MTMPQLAQRILPPINPSDLISQGSRDFGTWQEAVQFAINNFILPIMAGLAILYIVWSGYQFFSSGGDPAKAEKARANLTYSVIGVILVLIAYALVAGLNTLIQASRPATSLLIGVAHAQLPNLQPLPADAFARLGVGGILTFIVQGLLILAGILAVLYIVIAGFQYITSSGDPARAEKARNGLVYAVIGVVVIALAYAIVNAVTDLLGGTTTQPSQQQEQQPGGATPGGRLPSTELPQ